MEQIQIMNLLRRTNTVYYKVNDKIEGPITPAMLEEKLSSGALALDTPIYIEGENQWRTFYEQPVTQVDEHPEETERNWLMAMATLPLLLILLTFLLLLLRRPFAGELLFATLIFQLLLQPATAWKFRKPKRKKAAFFYLATLLLMLIIICLQLPGQLYFIFLVSIPAARAYFCLTRPEIQP